jgi:RNA polymerase sigma-70 factor (ECF subfamily)
MRRLRNRQQAEDAVQETLVAALEGMQGYAGQSSLETWLFGILRHKIVDGMRASGREEPIDADDEPFPGADPEEALARRRFVETLERSLRRMPACAARVFVMREVIGMETEEICRELSISVSNCWVTLHRARTRLRASAELRALAADAI